MKKDRLLDHMILTAGCLFMGLPVLLLALSSTHPASVVQESGLQASIGTAGFGVYRDVLLSRDLFGNGVTAADMLVLAQRWLMRGPNTTLVGLTI